MNARIRTASWIFCATSALALAAAPLAVAQTHAGPAPAQPREYTIESTASTVKDAAETQAQLMMLLRLSPVLTSVVARDPSLLADQAYVTKNNPELEQFLASHPDVARNPEFYLFSKLNPSDGDRDKALQRVIWPDLVPSQQQESVAPKFIEKLTPIIIVPAIFLAFVWIIRIFVEGHRWNRAFKQQSDVHARLIDKLGTNQDLAAYIESDSGKRFLSASPIALGGEPGLHMPNVVARVLTPLQAGIVMALLGIGFFFLRHAGPDMETGMTVMGTLALMPGIGFILSAGATWVLAHRLGLMPEKEVAQVGAAAPCGSQDRQ